MSMQERDLIVTQWHCMGGAGETSLHHNAMRLIEPLTSALQFADGRTKTKTMQFVHAFCDSESWEADIFLAKGSYMMIATNADDKYHFRSATAQVINKILARVCANSPVEYKFQSHSNRRSCASEALSHNGVSVVEVINCGGWAFDAESRVFMYFIAIDRGDMRVGRVVAGWPDTDRGGCPATAACLPKEDQPIFSAMARDLLTRYLSIHPPSLLEVLAASTVMYYNDVRKQSPDSIFLQAIRVAMMRVCDADDKDDSKLRSLSTTIKNA